MITRIDPILLDVCKKLLLPLQDVSFPPVNYGQGRPTSTIPGIAFLFNTLNKPPPTAGPSSHPSAPDPTIARPNSVSMSIPNSAGIMSTSMFPRKPAPVAVARSAPRTEAVRLYRRRERRRRKNWSQVIRAGGAVVAGAGGVMEGAVLAVLVVVLVVVEEWRGKRNCVAGCTKAGFIWRGVVVVLVLVLVGLGVYLGNELARWGSARQAAERSSGAVGGSNIFTTVVSDNGIGCLSVVMVGRDDNGRNVGIRDIPECDEMK